MATVSERCEWKWQESKVASRKSEKRPSRKRKWKRTEPAVGRHKLEAMLVYLLFIFACGWCVCWLLFLNYQQHSRDGRRCRGRGRAESGEWAHFQQDDHEQAELDQHDGFLEEELDEPRPLEPANGRAGGCCQRAAAAAAAGLKLDSVIDLYSEHALLLPAAEGGERADGCRCVDCQSAQFRAGAGGLLCGWPVGAAEEARPTAAGADDEHDGQLVDLWPAVELHENPLSRAPLGRLERHESGRAADQLARSRLLSLSEHQQERRAAIRMVSCSLQPEIAASRSWKAGECRALAT